MVWLKLLTNFLASTLLGALRDQRNDQAKVELGATSAQLAGAKQAVENAKVANEVHSTRVSDADLIDGLRAPDKRGSSNH